MSFHHGDGTRAENVTCYFPSTSSGSFNTSRCQRSMPQHDKTPSDNAQFSPCATAWGLHWDLGWYILRDMEAQREDVSPFSSDIDAHEHAMSLPVAEVVRELDRLLGSTMVAAIGGVSETRAVVQWQNGRAPQRPHVLRFALQIAQMIATNGDGEVAKAWFYGGNPHLDDATPVTLLREQPLEEIQGQLLAAARSFALRKNHNANSNGGPVADTK